MRQCLLRPLCFPSAPAKAKNSGKAGRQSTHTQSKPHWFCHQQHTVSRFHTLTRRHQDRVGHDVLQFHNHGCWPSSGPRKARATIVVSARIRYWQCKSTQRSFLHNNQRRRCGCQALSRATSLLEQFHPGHASHSLAPLWRKV